MVSHCMSTSLPLGMPQGKEHWAGSREARVQFPALGQTGRVTVRQCPLFSGPWCPHLKSEEVGTERGQRGPIQPSRLGVRTAESGQALHNKTEPLWEFGAGRGCTSGREAQEKGASASWKAGAGKADKERKSKRECKRWKEKDGGMNDRETDRQTETERKPKRETEGDRGRRRENGREAHLKNEEIT